MTSARPEGAIASLEKAFARYRPIVDGWDDFIAALLRPLPPTIWTNTLRTTPARLIEELGELGLDVEPLSWHPGAFRVRAEEKPGKHWPLVAGLYHIQEEVSLVPARLLEPRPGERVLDLCACPGNKTAQM
ncbi:MAG TPA: RNA methyltransferase, partial [Planctomycetota bacterium]|nr:RNA methyltransferase [Planctomycetota bacterium]